MTDRLKMSGQATFEGSPSAIVWQEFLAGRGLSRSRDGEIGQEYGQAHARAPFSSAGKGRGFADERHLWPALFYLIEQRQPQLFFGEEVESAVAHKWLDLVQADMEGLDYSFGASVFAAGSVGAPHKRIRLYFVSDSDFQRGQRMGAEAAEKERRIARGATRPVPV